jgi:hypothetical protein
MIGLAVISLVTMTATAAFAYVTGGSFRLKCVDGLVTVTQLGNVTEEHGTPTFLTLDVRAYATYDDAGEPNYPDVAVICGNAGNDQWTSPGIQIAEWAGEFSGLALIDPSTVQKNGKAYVGVNADPTAEDLAQVSAACPGGENTNWTAIDMAILNQMEAYVEEVYKDDAGTCWIKSTALFTNCHIPNLDPNLPDYDPLEWYPPNADYPDGHFEIREYVCDEPIRVNYKQNPALYSSVYPGFACP